MQQPHTPHDGDSPSHGAAASPPAGAPAHHGNMAAMLAKLPKGAESPSGHYWCAMCKKMFELDAPVCPYMPSMCVNTPIPVESLPPGSAAFYERYGLFYPKTVQRVLAWSVSRAEDPAALGVQLAEDFIADTAAWGIKLDGSPVEAMKAFLIYTSGFDAAVRTTAEGMTFYVMDAQSIWGEQMEQKRKSKGALLAGARRVARALGVAEPLDLHFMSVTSGPMGRYYCAQCAMFFEFGQPQSQVTCPFMPQKCKFKPKPIDEIARAAGSVTPLDLAVLTKILGVSPKLYRRQLATAVPSSDAAGARQIVLDDLKTWGFDLSDPTKVDALMAAMGLADRG